MHYFISISANNDAVNETLKEIESFVSSVNNCKKYHLYHENKRFIEFYPISMENGQNGFLYVDHTHSCFPLVLYPDNHKYKTNASRTDGFLYATRDIDNRKDQLIKLFTEHSSLLLNNEDQEIHFKNFHEQLHKFIHVNR